MLHISVVFKLPTEKSNPWRAHFTRRITLAYRLGLSWIKPLKREAKMKMSVDLMVIAIS